METTEAHTHRTMSPYLAYVIGFVLSVVTTLIAYFLVVNKVFTSNILVLAVMGIAVAQLVVQMIFFLHVGRSDRMKLATTLLTLLMVFIVAVGTIWVMYNMNYNMMDMSPAQQQQYMKDHEGI